MHKVENFTLRTAIPAETRQLTQYSVTLRTLTDLRSCYVPEGPAKVAVQ